MVVNPEDSSSFALALKYANNHVTSYGSWEVYYTCIVYYPGHEFLRPGGTEKRETDEQGTVVDHDVMKCSSLFVWLSVGK